MKSIPTRIREQAKNIFSFLEYSLWLLADFSKYNKIKKDKIKKVLIIHLGSIGELMAITPVFPALKKELNCTISFMLGKGTGKDLIYKNNPYISEILALEDSFKKNIEELKKRNFDLAIILYPATFKINLMCLLAKIRYRIGCFPIVKGGPSFFLTKRIFPLNLDKKNAIQEGLDMIRQIGIDNPAPKLEFYITDKEKKDLSKTLKKLKIKDYIVVHAGGSFLLKYKENSSKIWPSERYAEVIDYLTEKYNFKVFLTGSKKDEIFAKEIYEKLKNKKKVIIANELFDIRGLGALVSKARLLIAHGTGIVHIASAFNLPSVVFEGRGDPAVWHPWNVNCKQLFHPEVCTGCNRDFCRKDTRECILSITTEEVINAADELLKKK